MSPLFFFVKQLKTHYWALIGGWLLTWIVTISSIALLGLSGWFISASAFTGLLAITAMQFNYFIPAAVIRLLALARILSRYGERVLNHDVTLRILTRLRVWFYEKLIPLAPAHLFQQHSGDLLNRIVHDIDTLDHLYLRILSPMSIALLIAINIPLFFLHYAAIIAQITLVFFAISITLIPAAGFWFGKQLSENTLRLTATLRIQIVDMIHGATDLLIFTNKNDRHNYLLHSHNALLDTQKQQVRLKGIINGSMALLSGFSVWLIIYISIPLVQHHIITGAQLAMILLCVIVSFEQLLAFPLACLSLGKTQLAAKRLLTISNEKPSVVFPATEKVTSASRVFLKQTAPVISIKNLTFTYPTRTAPTMLHYNLEISPGTHLGIVGHSGVGKTTLLHMIARIWDPDDGCIMLNDRNLKSFSVFELRSLISLVTQNIHIFNASVRDNITLMDPNFSDLQLWDVLEKVDLSETIQQLPNGLNTLMGEFGKHFSGGQIRRIAIARALVRSTPIILLDEPSAGLNDALTEKILENCDAVFHDKTIIVATHDPYLVTHFEQLKL